MPDWNPLIGSPPAMFVDAEPESESFPSETSELVVENDRTEFIVAAFVLGALALLILARAAGFQALIATRVSVGG